MQSLPIALELVSVNLSTSEIEFKVYDLDEKMQHVRGNLRDFLEYVQDAQDFREFRFFHSRLVAEHQQLMEQSQVCQQQIQRQQDDLKKTQATSQTELERIKAAHPIPIYNTALANTLTQQAKGNRLVASVAGILVGLTLCVTGEHAITKTLGGIITLGAGYASYVTCLAKVDDSQTAGEQRKLKQEGIRIQAVRNEAERVAQQRANVAQSELTAQQFQYQQLKQQIDEKYIFVKLAEFSQQANQELGTGIIYGSEEQQQLLKMLFYKQQNDEQAMVKGLAGAAILGLMVVGAVTGFKL